MLSAMQEVWIMTFIEWVLRIDWNKHELTILDKGLNKLIIAEKGKELNTLEGSLHESYVGEL